MSLRAKYVTRNGMGSYSYATTANQSEFWRRMIENNERFLNVFDSKVSS